MPTIHLDPWTDIVGVGWGKITHVAFQVSVYDPYWTQTSYDYPGGIGFFSTSVASVSQKLWLEGRWVLRRSGTTKTWQNSTSAVVAVTGFPDTGGRTKTLSNSWAECTNWEPLIGTVAPGFVNPQLMIGFASRRAGGVDIPAPGTAENFDSGLDTSLDFTTYPLSACTPGTNATTLDGSAHENVVIGASVLGGVSVTYRGQPCTIAGTWTPSLPLTSNGALPAVQVPKRLIVLASIDGVTFP